MKRTLLLIFRLILFCQAERWRFHPLENDKTTNIIYCFKSNDPTHKNQLTSISEWQTTKIESVLNVSKVAHLKLSGCGMDFLRENVKSYVQLIDLDLSDAKLSEFDFEILPSGLEQLDISNNYPITLDNIFALENSHLKSFNISGNRLENTAEILQHLNEKVLYLDLSGNHLDFEANLFARFGNLKGLFLRNVNLAGMKVNIFRGLNSLEILDVSDNNLEYFDFELISTIFEKLEFFAAMDCHIQNIPKLLGYLSENLQELDLSGNFIGAVNATTFNRFNFEFLLLRRSNLSNFNFDTLKHHTRLYTLDISQNSFEKLDLQLLSGSPLHRLVLHDNELTEITNLTRSNFPNLSQLSVANNNFSCEFLNRFLQQIKREFPGLEFVDDARQQKHGMDCKSVFGSNVIGTSTLV